MIVGIHQSVEVSNEQRKAISKTLDVKQATRDQLKDFIWKWGEQWQLMVDKPQTEHPYAQSFEEADPLAALDAALGEADGLDLI